MKILIYSLFSLLLFACARPVYDEVKTERDFRILKIIEELEQINMQMAALENRSTTIDKAHSKKMLAEFKDMRHSFVKIKQRTTDSQKIATLDKHIADCDEAIQQLEKKLQ